MDWLSLVLRSRYKSAMDLKPKKTVFVQFTIHFAAHLALWITGSALYTIWFVVIQLVGWYEPEIGKRNNETKMHFSIFTWWWLINWHQGPVLTIYEKRCLIIMSYAIFCPPGVLESITQRDAPHISASPCCPPKVIAGVHFDSEWVSTEQLVFFW